jgi:rod shape-determining protein MreC
MLLVFTDPRTPEQRATESAEAQEAVDRQKQAQSGQSPSAAAAAPPPAPAAEQEPRQ